MQRTGHLLPSIDPGTGAVGTQGLAYKNYGALDVLTSLVERRRVLTDGSRGLAAPTPVRRLGEALRAFFHMEASGGLLLVAAAAVALLWANSPLSGAYDALWHTELRVGAGSLSVTDDLRHWVNDALMVLFFFVVGLEIKRELVTGELRDRPAAAPDGPRSAAPTRTLAGDGSSADRAPRTMAATTRHGFLVGCVAPPSSSRCLANSHR